MKLFHARYAQVRHGIINVIEDDFYMPNQYEVRRHLHLGGYWPIRIHEQKKPLFEWADVRSSAWAIQLLRALRFQGVTTSAGTALLNIIEAEEDPKRRIAFLSTRAVLKGGGSFSDALKALRLFDAATMAIITAGERAGDLKGVVQHAIEHTEQKGKGTKVIVTALSWLAFDILNVVSSLWGAEFGFIPYLRKQGSKASDPAAAAHFEHAIKIASWIDGTLLAIVGILLMGGAGFVMSYWANKDNPDHYTTQIMMRTPIISSFLRNGGLKDSCKLMQRLLMGKVPLVDAIDIVADGVIEPATKIYWRESKKKILAGIPPSRALINWPLLKGETDQFNTIQSVEQLSEVFEAIAEERGLMAKADQRRMAMTGMITMMVLFGATILTMIYLLMIQNDSMLDSLKSMRS